ncbi:MAG: FAD-binding oxidoreductase [Thermomicrobiales bacterium]
MKDSTSPGRRWTPAIVTRIERRTPSVISLFLLVEIPGSLAGQHVDIRLTAPDGYQAQRSYSIASAPGSDELELIVERLDDGEVSPYVHEFVQPGDTIDIRGPIGGHFIWEATFEQPVLLVAAGSGAAPLISILRHRLESKSGSPMLLLYSARTWDDVICRDELLDIAKLDSALQIMLTLTRLQSTRPADFNRRIDSGLVEETLQRWGHIPARTYVCGSNDFVDPATTALIANGIPAPSIRTERYG